MNISKEVRYAMIRRAVMKVQRKHKIIHSNKKLAREVELLDRGDYKSEISEKDTGYITDQFTDVMTATLNEDY